MTKIYHSFHDIKGNHYSFKNYMDFAEFWFSLSHRNARMFFEQSIFKKLSYAASQSKEARTPLISL
jgi:hypothetical protein